MGTREVRMVVTMLGLQGGRVPCAKSHVQCAVGSLSLRNLVSRMARLNATNVNVTKVVQGFT